jgi:ribokinase
MPACPRILVIGAINLDLVVQVDRMPLLGETMPGRSLMRVPGGKAANQAVAAARLGARVAFVGRVGEDEDGRFLAQQLEREGVDTTHLKRSQGRPTGLAMIFVAPDGRNTIVAAPGANLLVTPADVDAALAAGATGAAEFDAMMLTLETPLETVKHAVAAARHRGMRIVLDAAPPFPGLPLEELGGLTVLSPNETEAAALGGSALDSNEGAVKAGRCLRQRSGARYVVLKLGERGAMIVGDPAQVGGEGAARVKPFQVEAVDCTAAGDAFTAAMTVLLCEGMAIESAVGAANAAGAIAVTRVGAQPSLPTRAELERFIESRDERPAQFPCRFHL